MTIADSTRTSTRSSETPPSFMLSWRGAGRKPGATLDPTDLRPEGPFSFVVRVDPGELADTGVLTGWFQTEETRTEVIPATHVDITRVQEQGWTHLEIRGEEACRCALSLHDGALRYVTTDLTKQAGLPGGSYDAPGFEELSTDEPPA